ncbi:hypothetical protein AWB64_00460 [Caballeronia sordidicola]|uniref:Uncharacterized protein n=1 Tax=Caballeronia sordidicola TaxID=196367 RepID=A0A158EWR5_CABSO|nr:HEPN domain-containing protein [Caballeronia sordidicola]SAL11968.1 hypothetical protein AWB64_00460 [Caballeronia sordidicola]
MRLNKKQLEALHTLIQSLEFSSTRLFEVRDPHAFEKLRAAILYAAPWKDFIDYGDLLQIFWTTAFQEATSFPENFVGYLSCLDEGITSNRLFQNIREELEAIPSVIDVFVPLSGLMRLEQAEIPITEHITLIDGSFSEELRAYVESAKPSNGLLKTLGKEVVSNRTGVSRFIKVRGSGFASDDPEGNVMSDALSIIKQFVFIGLATGTLGQRYSPRRWDMRSTAGQFPSFVVDQRGPGHKVHGVSVPYDLNDFLQQLYFKEPLEVMDSKPGKSLLTANKRAATTGEDIHQAVRLSFSTASKFLSLKSPDSIPIRAAMEWYVDSSATSNESIAFLQRCIGLEALLGVDGGRRDVTERLADRYAYMLGRTESERMNLRQAFKGMYSHRGDVVHGRASKLMKAHRPASAAAAEMLLRCTWAEMHNMLRSTNSGTA